MGLVRHCLSSFGITGISLAEKDVNLRLRIAARRWVPSGNDPLRTIRNERNKRCEWN